MKNLCLLFVCCVCMISVADAANRPVVLSTAQEQVSVAFDRLDAGLKKAAVELGKTGLTGDAARRVLAAACDEFNYAVDCGTVDASGRLLTIEPAQYRSFEGKDISGQEQVKKMLKRQKPVLSSVFRSVEGYDAVDAEYPIFNSDGSFIGSVSIMFKPEKFLGNIIKPLVKGVPLDIWGMEQGGRILYDVDPQQVGLNIFTSPQYQPYKQLVKFVKKIARTPQGEGSYRFKKGTLTGQDADKKAYWQSVSLYGTSWRLVCIHLEQEQRVGHPTAALSTEQVLERFAKETVLTAALASGKKDDGMKEFKSFYEATPGIYSIQWIDVKGINRFGYPAENSLSDYDYNSGTAPRDKETVQIVDKQNSAAFETPLFEGKTGAFVFKPVFREGRYLGMIYTIKLKND